MNGRQIVVALIRLAGLQTLWTAFWNLTYISQDKARYLIEVNGLPKSAEMTLISMKMIIFRCALSVMFGLTLILLAHPLAGILMREEKSVTADPDM
jgi:hypothetical protein